MSVIKHRYTFLGVSLALTIVAICALFFFGLKQGIDFRGGTLWLFHVSPEGRDIEKIKNTIQEVIESPDVHVQVNGDDVFARFPEISESAHQTLVSRVGESNSDFQELAFQSIGPSIGAALQRKSYTALALVLLGISLYIAFAFRKVFKPVSSWKYGVVTLITLAHDVIIPAGLLAVLGRYRGVEIDGNFVVALLVVMGFSVHDTIVVFDRIRENLLLDRGKSGFGDVVNRSVNQTLARSINTSLTLILVLLALLFAGPSTLFYFVLTLLVGVSIGIYSSIFVASPLLYLWHRG